MTGDPTRGGHREPWHDRRASDHVEPVPLDFTADRVEEDTAASIAAQQDAGGRPSSGR